MPFDWLKRLRGVGGGRSSARRGRRTPGTPASLESRTLLSVTPLGVETRVNTFTTGSQKNSAIATDADGDYVVTWASDGQDGDSYGIYAQRYNAAGIALGTEFRVNSTTTGAQNWPAIGMDADGDFVITWGSNLQDGSLFGIYAQRYNASGVAQGGEFRVNTFTTGNQDLSAVGMDADGDFVISWRSFGQDGSDFGIYAKRFNAAGVVQGSEFRVNTFTAGVQDSPAVGIDADGDFVISWSDAGQDGSGYGIYVQRYNASGVAQGSEFRANFTTTGHQFASAIGLDADGDFVITWQSVDQDGSGSGIYAQRYNAAGGALGAEFLVNSTTTHWQSNPAIGLEADGDFVITWESYLDNENGYEVYAQRYNATGAALGGEFHVNTVTTFSQVSPAIGVDAEGDFVIAWQSSGQEDAFGIYTQRYRSLTIGSETRVNTYTTGFQSNSAVATDANGDYVITWSSFGQDGDGYGIYAQRYNAAGVALGTEFRVNSYTTGSQSGASIGMDDDGNFVVAWESSQQDGSEDGIYAKRFNALGVAQGAEFQVNSWTTNSQHRASVAVDGDGDFIITWISVDQDGSDGGVFAQRFNAAGVAQGSEFQVNSITTHNQTDPAVAMDANGDFVIVWHTFGTVEGTSAVDFGVSAQRYNSVGVPQGTQIAVNSYLSPAPVYYASPSVGMDEAGAFVVVWGTRGQDRPPNSWGVFGKRFDPSGNPLGSEFQVNTFTTGTQFSQSVAMNREGAFVVSWSSFPPSGETGQDGSESGIFAQRYTSAGIPTGGEFQVNSFVTGAQESPAIAMDDDGDFVVAWTSYGQDGDDYGIYAQRYRSLDAGRETRVNSTTTATQNTSAVATDANGNYVVTWTSYGQDGDGYGIYAQRYNAAGIPQGTEFRVNSFTISWQYSPAIGMDADGDFVITWTSTGQDGSGYGIYAQRYNAAGVVQGTEFQVNSYTSSYQRNSAIGMDADGDFVITWHSLGQDGDGYGVYARRFNAAGVAQGTEFRVNSSTTGTQYAPTVGLDANGDFVIAWASFLLDGSTYEIYAQRYNAAGVAQGGEFRVNTHSTNWQILPAIGLDADGDFVVTWHSIGQDGSSYGIYAQRYNAAGIAQGSEFRVNSYTNGHQFFPSIGVDADGDFAIAWTSSGQDGNLYGVYAQRYNAAGVPVGTEFRVNSVTTNHQGASSIALDADGDFVISWQSIGTPASNYDIYSQRYRVNNAAPVLNAAGAPTLSTIPQSVAAANNPGTLVAEIIARMSPNGGISDIDFDTLQGIAVNGLTGTANGTWQYTVNGGTNWTPMTVTGNANALLLAADGNSRIRFLPNAGFLGEAKIAFVAWDRTSGANGGTANVTTRGGTTPYSLAYEYASINVVNVAPELDADGTPTLDPVLTNAYNVNNPGTLVSDIISRMAPNGGISDANPGALQGIAINGLLNTDKGSWQFTTNGGTSWISIGTTGNSNARLLAADANTRIRFVPIAGFAGTASFAFVAWDRTTGANGGIASVGTRGGSTAYSTAFDYASISVVNAAPVLNDLGAPLLDGILPDTPDASNPGTLVSTIMSRMSPGGSVTDANPSALRGIAIIGKTATATGTWEYSINNGTTWLAINATGGANALLLASDANTRVRYRPNAGFRGEAKIAFTAWDQTTGTNGGTVNASTRGGTTAFSLAYEYASIFVNTAPTLDASGTPTLDAIPNTISNVANIGTPVNTILNRMGPGGITDPDPGALRGMAIIGLTGTANGTWQYTINNGTNWSNILTTGSANALLLSNTSTTKIRFVPNPGFVGTASIAFTAWDRTQGVNGATVNAGLRGGATPFSSLFDYAAISVTG